MNKYLDNFTGTRRQMLVAEKFLGYPTNSSDQLWLFRCDCGNSIKKRKNNFLASTTNNCGCEHGNQKHGFSGNKHPIYSVWVNMRSRCNNKKNPDYPYYGGKGIYICKRWDNFSNFLQDMGERPSDKHTIDRIDNTKGYEPDNCRWATRKRQSRNRRMVKRITYKGKTKTLGEWSDELPINISEKNLYKRIYTRGWSVERAFTQPLK